MSTSTAGIAILGVGTIGGAVARAVAEQGDLIAARYGFRPVVRAVLERSIENAIAAGIPADRVYTDLAAVAGLDDVDVVVEVLGGEQPAADFMAQSLAAGKHVVTANKEALSKHFGRLTETAREHDRALLFEASVGGGIPLMVSYRQILASNRVTSVRGIVNGTTNFILSQMAESGTTYDDALAEAQQLGYAEPDPTADVEGYDAAYKVAILASMMAGRHVLPDEVDRTGITGVSPDDVQDARARGGAIKLIASARLADGKLELRVAPEFVPGDNMLAHVRANINAIEIVGDRVGPVVLSGQGAGPLPTASALLSDAMEAVRIGSAANARTALPS